MLMALPTDMSKDNPIDPTTDNKWLLQHSDRLIAYEFELRLRSKNSQEMFPEELADKIGRPKEYVSNIIKNAISHAKACYDKGQDHPCKKPSRNTP
jgi:hypothetical protein